MQTYSSALIEKLKEREGKSLDILEWYECMTTNLAGNFVFGESFHCL